MNGKDERVRDYFRVKAQQLIAAARLPACDHAGLAGSHREEIQRIYLSEIMPRRYGVGRGMVYGLGHRSREADIVIWDALNYPSLPMSDHSFFFAESVRAVIESKSTWSRREFRDVLTKCQAVRDIVPVYLPSIDDTIAMLELEVAALKEQRSHSGMLHAPPHIGTAAVFLAGGLGAYQNGSLTEAEIDEVDDRWPDALLLLEPGRLVLKDYSEDEGGRLLFFELGEDALMAFTNSLLRLVAERSVLTEGAFYLERHAHSVLQIEPYAVARFPLHRLMPGRIPLWRG